MGIAETAQRELSSNQGGRMAEADSKSQDRRGSGVDDGGVDTGVIVAGRLSTGRSEWTEDLKTFMRERPLTGVALMIGVGFALGKFVRR